MPSWRSSGSSSASGSRVHKEYSVCSAATGCTAWARRIVSGPASDNPMLRTLPSATSSARVPTVSSMGVFGSRELLGAGEGSLHFQFSFLSYRARKMRMRCASDCECETRRGRAAA